MGFLGKKKLNTRESSSGELAAAEKTLSSVKPEITAAGVEISSPTDAVDGRDDVATDKNIKATRLIKKSNNNTETRDTPITMHKRASTTIGGKGSSGRSRAFSDDSNLNKCRDPPRPKSVPNASLPSSPGKAYKKTVSNSDRTRVTSNKKYVDDKETPRVSNLTTERHVRSAESLKKKLHILSLEEESSMASSFDSSYISGDDDDDDSASEYDNVSSFDDTIDRGISKSYSTDLSTADGTTRSRSFVETMWSKARKGVGIMSPNNSTIASSMAGTSFDDTLGSKSFDDTLGSKSLSTCSSGDTADEIEVDKAAKEKEGGKGGVKKTIASPNATVVKKTIASPKAEPSPKDANVVSKNPSAGPSPKVSNPEAGAATATKEEEEVATDEVAASQSNGVSPTKKSVIKVTKLVSNYLMEMEKFCVKSSEAQLLLRVAEHGNVTKMSLRVSDELLMRHPTFSHFSILTFLLLLLFLLYPHRSLIPSQSQTNQMKLSSRLIALPSPSKIAWSVVVNGTICKACHLCLDPTLLVPYLRWDPILPRILNSEWEIKSLRSYPMGVTPNISRCHIEVLYVSQMRLTVLLPCA